MQFSELPAAKVAISIDVDANRETSFLCTDLVEILQNHQAPALWSLGFTEPSPLVQRIREGSSAHEFGILATPGWAGPACSRRDFSRQLSARAACARREGVAVTALALQRLEPPKHFDLIAQHTIPLLRTRTDRPPADPHARPSMARFGMSQADPTLVVPAVSRWSIFWTARRMFKRAIATGETILLAVPMEQLAKNPPGGLATLDSLLRAASARQSNGELRIVPPSHLATAASARISPVACRSALRAA